MDIEQEKQLVERIIQRTKEGKICWELNKQQPAWPFVNIRRDNPYAANCGGMNLKLFTDSCMSVYFLEIGDGKNTTELVEHTVYRGLPSISSLFEIVDEPAEQLRRLKAEESRINNQARRERLLLKLAQVL